MPRTIRMVSWKDELVVEIREFTEKGIPQTFQKNVGKHILEMLDESQKVEVSIIST